MFIRYNRYSKKQIPMLLASVFVSFCFFLSCTKDNSDKAAVKQNKLPDQTIKQVHLTRSINARVDIELTSPLIEIYSGDSARMCCPKGLEVLFLNFDLSHKAKLTANYAVNYEKSNVYYIRDNVRIIDYKQQDTFYCKDLYWIKDSALLRTDLPIQRHSASGIDFGDGLRANDSFDSVIIKNPHGSQNVEED